MQNWPYGSVCDFIGIRATGIFSLGDLGLVLGIALTPIAAFQLFAGRATVLRLGIGAAVAICNLMFGLWNAPGGLLLAYMVVLVVALGCLNWVLKEARVSRASSQAGTAESIAERPPVP